MKTDILITGVGGQGILTMAYLLVSSAHEKGLFVKQTEVHGMAQRGGGVESHVRISDQPIHSDAIPLRSAEFILGIEPMESLRYVRYLSPKGIIITSTSPMVNVANYPNLDTLYAEVQRFPHRACDTKQIARYAGSPLSENVVAVGALLPFLEMVPKELIIKYLHTLLSKKGEKVVHTNLQALTYGENASRFYQMGLESGIDAAHLFYPAVRREPVPPSPKELELWKRILANGKAQETVEYLKRSDSLYKVNPSSLASFAEQQGNQRSPQESESLFREVFAGIREES